MADVNDEAPVIKPQEKCAMITEFHEPNERITIVTATDKDDPATANGRVRFDIIGGNDNSMFSNS